MKLKVVGGIVVGVVIAVNGYFVADMGRVAAKPVCQYVVETPTGADAYLSLQDAYNTMVALGVDPRNTPDGYDITSKVGC